MGCVRSGGCVGRRLPGILLALAALLAASAQAWAQGSLLTADRKRAFLRTAEVVAAEQTSTGITQPWRLTLTDATLTHDAVFQSVDERDQVARLGRRRELNFVDSYRYNIAAYELAVLLGLDDMVPVTVERAWRGRTGALSWWIDDVMFDEATRLETRQRPDDVATWSAQLARMRVFEALVHDTDRNKTNLLYTRDWTLHMIDFTRAFRVWDELQHPEDLVRIDRQLFHRLGALADTVVQQTLRPFLSPGEVNGLLKRRDRLLEHFSRLIEQKGEAGVLQ